MIRPATEKLLRIISEEMLRPQHPGSVYLTLPLGLAEHVLAEWGMITEKHKRVSGFLNIPSLAKEKPNPEPETNDATP